ncbi:MAG: hypothetical protein IT324_33020 [Anaerolineae bacterium]|nr:hypothetical protein [Anaerolineae bacterium]
MTATDAPRFPKFWQNRTFQVNVLIFLGLLGVCWVYFGFAFGPYPIDGGDTTIYLSSSLLGHFPFCISSINPINPYRPFVATPICLSAQLFGPSVLALFIMGVVIFAAAAFMWQAVIRSVFGVPVWLGFAIALIFLSYPDLRLPTYGNCLTRMAGPTLVLIGCWLVLRFWDRQGSVWLLVAGCIAAISGLLTYESLFGAWVIALPLALLYKSKRLSLRWLWVSAIIAATSAGYLVWRVMIVPATFTDRTYIVGGSAAPVVFNPLNIIRQIGQANGLVFWLWNTYFPLPTHLLSGTDGWRTWLVLIATVGFVLIMLLLIIRRSPEPMGQSVVRSIRIGPKLFLSGLLFVPIAALPYLFTTIDAMGSGYISFGTSFCTSLVIAALLITSKHWKTTLIRVSVVVTVLVAIATVHAGAASKVAAKSPVCDFATRFTEQVQQLPPDYFVIVKSGTAPDEWVLSTMMGYLYYNGPVGVDTYDVGRMGYQGYYFIRTGDVQLNEQGIRFNWHELIHLTALYRFKPFPDPIPLSQGIVVAYEPFEKLTFLHVPDQLKSLLQTSQTEPSQAQTRLRALCNWY